MDTACDLHESTENKKRGRDGKSDRWRPAWRLREGYSTSPLLFNVFHQAVMRQAEEERETVWGEVGVE